MSNHTCQVTHVTTPNCSLSNQICNWHVLKSLVCLSSVDHVSCYMFLSNCACQLSTYTSVNHAPIHEMGRKNDTHGLLICFWKKHFEKISQKNCNFITPIISSQGHRIKLEPKVPSKQRQRNLKTQLYFYV